MRCRGFACPDSSRARHRWRPRGTLLILGLAAGLTQSFTLVACDAGASHPIPPSVDQGEERAASAGEGVGASESRDDTAAAPVPSAEILVGRLGAQTLQWDDLRRTIQLRALLNDQHVDDFYPPAWWEDARIIETLAMQTMENLVLRSDASQVDLIAPPDRVATEIANHPVLSRLSELSPDAQEDALAPYAPLTWGDIERAAEERVLREMWLDRVLENIGDDVIRAAYDRDRDRATIEVVLVPNIPQNDAIDRLLHGDSARVEALYNQRLGAMLAPPSAVGSVARIEIPRDLDTSSDAHRHAIAALEHVRELVIGGTQLADLSTHDVVVETDVRISQSRAPALFANDGPIIGAPTEIVLERGGAFFAVFDTTSPAQLRPLDDALRRELAAQLVAQEHPDPERQARAQRIFDAMQDDDEDALAAALRGSGARLEQPRSFSRDRNHSVAGVGRSEELSRIIFEELENPRDMPEGPIFTRDGFAVVRLVSRERPSDDGFREHADDIRAQVIQRVQSDAWTQRIQDVMDAHGGREIDTERIRALIRETHGTAGTTDTPRPPLGTP